MFITFQPVKTGPYLSRHGLISTRHTLTLNAHVSKKGVEPVGCGRRVGLTSGFNQSANSLVCTKLQCLSLMASVIQRSWPRPQPWSPGLRKPVSSCQYPFKVPQLLTEPQQVLTAPIPSHCSTSALPRNFEEAGSQAVPQTIYHLKEQQKPRMPPPCVTEI